jgi:hypothetical protein
VHRYNEILFCKTEVFTVAYMESLRLLGCGIIPVGEWFSAFQRIIVPSSLKLKQSRRIDVLGLLEPEGECTTVP